MPVLVRGLQLESRELNLGVISQSILSSDVTGSNNVSLDLITLNSNTKYSLSLKKESIGWLQVLNGSGVFDESEKKLSSNEVIFLPLGYRGCFTASSDQTKLLIALVPEAERFDKNIQSISTNLKITDWSNEPVLKSEHDERTRIYLATRTLSGTEAYRCEMIRYPAGTSAPDHHHEGAEHFQYVLKGTGTAMLDGKPCDLIKGDALYNFDHEVHSFRNNGSEEFVFVEFFVPGGCKTVWAPNANVCAWLPTGKDIHGRPPSRDIAYHVHGDDKDI